MCKYFLNKKRVTSGKRHNRLGHLTLLNIDVSKAGFLTFTRSYA